MLKEKFDYSAAAGWRDLIWVRVNYWDAEGSMAKSEVLLFTQWRLLAAFRKSWLFKLWRLQGNIRRAWLNLCAHEVSLICSRINLVKKILRVESVNLKSFQVWRSPVSGEFIAFQWGSWEKQWQSFGVNMWWNSLQTSQPFMIHERAASARAGMGGWGGG